MKYNGESIYGCTQAEPEFTAPRGTRLTQSNDGKRLYIHLMEYPYAFLEFPGLADKIDYAQFLHDGSEILYTLNKVEHFSESTSAKDNMVAFKIPYVKPDVIVPVIEVFLK
jgi:alpha-L-fucosidase